MNKILVDRFVRSRLFSGQGVGIVAIVAGKKMKKVLLTVCFGLFSGVAIADQGDSGFGIEGALAFADLEDGARTISQALANSSGRTLTYTYEESTVAMRLYGFVSRADEIDFVMGYVRTASMDANYSFSGTSDTVLVGVDAVGFDYGLRFKPSEELFFKIGMHMLEVDGTISATVFVTPSV